MKVSLITLGCRSNAFDTELMANYFKSKGYEVVNYQEQADIYIINTCTVTSEADRSSRQAIHRAKRKNPKALVVATGCYAQVNPQALSSMQDVDMVVGNSHKHRIVELIEEFLQDKGENIFVDNIFRQSRLESFDLITFFEKARPFIKVQEGCNRFCTFCVIPYARGKVRSVPPEKVIKEVELLARKGFQEVVLTGTQLTQYGWDMGTSLYELLRGLIEVKGIELIRLSSMHPSEIEGELLELITSEEKIASHFHISLQSGSDRILKLMEREYTVSDYVRIVDKIISKRPISAVGTDIIVGFPTETEEDFEQTYRLLEGLPIAYMHVFPYSDRPFTKASKMEGKVFSQTKEERVKILKELDSEKRREFYEKNRGRELRATVIDYGKLLTENYIQINTDKHSIPTGKVIKITV
ncbi:tRNA (N(6)-L-threonylcarbamoyladenosine(37)-C(2))-methylthiotransferase MtaB [Pampinifervens florentissimum]|uniref:tRNA (N(6)-L-threonylcarbamoyladenosine(37)-C(2))- methylthiotransferase MtaB n=1 Tax=Pampinifervens florentissimum TaxID=1632019 RepID=UPI0013B49664|nr:tRNA (N(6)-L-threonylcarbamoyladenosine(37)-C(2))-methylthiotransferase MtaB [Hydrogenobacter sp. T-8]QID33380.1 tRNA (N(6)-L-threonylcarbamoyladenosine(37)-C(2))-methylthiotransferase MtaB [Hydrogenobacter sp. T-8]